jgi:hypothetical protein
MPTSLRMSESAADEEAGVKAQQMSYVLLSISPSDPLTINQFA